MNNNFNFTVPILSNEIQKAKKFPKGDPNRYKNMVIKGMASDNSKDVEEEIMEPSGFILDRFLSNGYLNYEHLSKKSSKFLIGEPISAEVKDNKFYVEGKLWEKSDTARDIWDTLIDMEESGSTRKAGFSIEGKALARNPMNPKHITKALITSLAVTFSPVNGNTFLEIVKGTQKQDFVEPEYEKLGTEKEYLFEFTKDGKTFRVGKDYKVFEVIEKTMDITAQQPLIPESLGKKVKPIVNHDIQKSIESALFLKELGAYNDDVKNKLKNILIK